MPKILTEKQINSFVKGLITEANPLTFPENASLSEENFDLETDGSRSRRLGVDYEESYVLTDTGINTAVLASTRQSTHTWGFPGGATNVTLGVIRVFDRLYFVNLQKANPSAYLMNSGNYITLTGLENSEIQTANINGYFVVVSKDLALPVLLSYDKDTDIVSQEDIQIFVRDLNGIDDEITTNARPVTLTEKHKYNLMNQGWNERISSTCYGTPGDVAPVQDGYYRDTRYRLPAPTGTIGAIECTKNILGVYPANSDVWTFGKEGNITSGDFEKYNPTHLVKNSLDNTLAPRGSYTLNMFNRGTSRASLSGATGLVADKENGRVATVCTYAGRVFYSGIISEVNDGDRYSPNYSGYIFFTQIATNKEKLSNCFQENDPTSPDISDILDTDGGTIQIPEVTRIVKLVNTRSSLVVFAENGIWEIFGDTKGFVATSFQISKVSSIGITNPNTVVDANGAIIYWASTGIHALVQEPTTGRLITQNMSVSTIQSFYNNIPLIAKQNARGFYDEVHNHIRWLYNDSDTYSETNYINHYTKELSLDLVLQAFYLYTISSLTSSSPVICDYITTPSYITTTVDSNVYVGNELVQITGPDDVVITIDISSDRTANYRFLTFTGSGFTISYYKDTSFFDWVSADGVGINFDSFLITGYELTGDMMRKKQVPYIFFYFNKTEDGFKLEGDNLVFTNPSGCTVQAQWNWSDSAASGKWGTAFNAYRFIRPYIPSGSGDTFDNGEGVVVTKNKLRGSGRALSLKINSVPGKDMQLLGWATEITGNSKG